MNRMKKNALALLFPHPIVTGLLVPLACALLIYAFVGTGVHPAVQYGSYALSAYALTVAITTAPKFYRAGMYVRDHNRYVVRYRTDVRYRMVISLCASLVINALYAVMQLLLGVYHRAGWFYALAGYYALLAVMRWVLLGDVKSADFGSDRFTELLRYRLCGVLLLLINQALAVMVAYIVWRNRGFVHHEIVTIAMAAYTFASMALAVASVVRFRKYDNPVLSAAKAISLASALVSVLSLETAMLTAFGQGNSPFFRQIMTALTGFAVCTAVLAMAVYMIVKSTKEINQIKRGAKQHE